VTERRHVTRSAAGMGAATIVSRGFGFSRALVIAAVLGTTFLGNTFQSSNAVSNVVFELVAAGALSSVLVPSFVTLFEVGQGKEAERQAGVLLGYAVVWLGALSIIGMIGSPWIADLLSRGVRDAATRHQQEALATFFLLFFIPQIVFYAFGAVAEAVLNAQRRFVLTSLAPIGNTIAMVVALVVFWVLRGGRAPSLDLTFAEKLTLALGGTVGVVAFVAVPVIALWRDGIRLIPRFVRHDAAVGHMLRLSSWAIIQNTGVGILLATALIVGNAVAGGTVAYQTAFVFFLAPYAVFAESVQTAILPDMSLEADRGDLPAFAGSMQWALSSLFNIVLPISLALAALSPLVMHVAVFGAAKHPGIYAAALASLAVGILPYSMFLLVARSYYALHDSRRPAIVAIITATLGSAVMIVIALFTGGTALVAGLGIGHTVAYTLATLIMLVDLRRRAHAPVWPTGAWRPMIASAVVAGGIAVAVAYGYPSGRLAAGALGIGLTLVGGLVYFAILRGLGGKLPPLRRLVRV
jgi:putative peptidoglycan lipid II flippase